MSTVHQEQHVILITHTPLHLERSLAGFAYQTRVPDSISVSCDGDRPEIREAIESACRSHKIRVQLVKRAHTGKARTAQARNNAVRALIQGGFGGGLVSPESRLIVLDGDTCPSRTCVELHARLGGARAMVSTYRVNLSADQTDGFDTRAMSVGNEPVEIQSKQLRELDARQSRYQRQRWLRAVGLGKDHKPRLIGGHFSVPLAAYVQVNGVDEAYEGYGQEDDDFARRLHRAGWPSVVAVKSIMVYHLYHPTRAPGDWHAAPGVARFSGKHPNRAELGLDRPMDQPEPSVEMIE